MRHRDHDACFSAADIRRVLTSNAGHRRPKLEIHNAFLAKRRRQGTVLYGIPLIKLITSFATNLESGYPIPRARLEAVPEAALTIQEQQARER